MRLDAMNLRILEMLQEDGRRTGMEIARALARAESTVRERLRAMERGGVIRGYRPVLDAEALGLAGKAIVRARVDLSKVERVSQRLRADPHVTHVWRTSGEWPLTFVLVAPTLRDLEALLAERIPELGVELAQADIVLQTPLEGEKRLPLTELLWPPEPGLRSR